MFLWGIKEINFLTTIFILWHDIITDFQLKVRNYELLYLFLN